MNWKEKFATVTPGQVYELRRDTDKSDWQIDHISEAIYTARYEVDRIGDIEDGDNYIRLKSCPGNIWLVSNMFLKKHFRRVA